MKLYNESAVPAYSNRFSKPKMNQSIPFSDIMASRQTTRTDTFHSIHQENTGIRPIDIGELGGSFDLQAMSQAEYDKFLEALEEKGVLSRTEMETIGYHNKMAGVVGASYSEQTVFHSLADAGGSAMKYINSMAALKACPLPTGEPNLALEQIISIYKRISHIILQI